MPLGGAYIAGHAGGTAASVSATTSSMALGVYSFMAHDGTQWTVNAGSFTYLAAGFYGTALTQPASQSFDFRGYLGGLGFEAFTYDMRNTDSSASIYINRLGQDVDTTIGYGSGTALTIDGGTGNITAGALSGSTANSLANIDTTQTFTNKRVTRRVATTDAPGATPTTNTDNVDIQTFTGLDTAITSMTTNLSGTPVDGDKLEIRFKDDGTARAITWGASFSNGGTVYLPTTTVTSTTLRVLLEYSTITSNTWVCIAVS